MAPPPEYDKEPKAPDKSVPSISTDDSKVLYNHVKDQPSNAEAKTTTTSASVEVENNKHVDTLDDGQLRALLDEAFTYKCPKDREGKSNLFKELLEEVEQDEQACEAAARGLGAGRAGRRARARREHHSSLQDLVAAMAGETAPRRGRAHAAAHAHAAPPAAPVSARALHGGSLPSGVDTSFMLSEEPAVSRGGYLATVRCVNPPPLSERRVSASDAPDPDPLARRSKPSFPVTYTARATLEIGSGSVSSGRAVTTTTASNQVDSAIPFSCITTPEVVASCNTTSSTTQSAVAVDPKPLQLRSSYRAVECLTGAWEPPLNRPPPAPAPATPPATPAHQPRSVMSSSFNGLARSGFGTGSSTATDDYKKSLDENGNAVQGFGSPLSGSSQHKKPRRKKSSKNETVIKSHQIDGYQGNKDLNEVLRFIESNAEGARGPKLRAKHDCDDKGKKRSSERRKDKDKVKRASSLEELSRTTLEDLTDKPAPAKPERRSWGDDARALLCARPAPAPAPAPAEPDPPPAELTDFQTVTKKRKPRRRADEPEPAPRPRAEPRARPAPSAPASDRSNDSNDDMDSVHSLPAAPPPPACASYADIARTRHNIPDLIESCNYYAEGEEAPPPPPGPPGAPPDDQYPALAARRKPAAPAPRAPRKERAEARAPEPAAPAPAPDVLGDRRPPVILLDSAARPPDMDGVTFGFDINEQLLGGGGRRARCDLLRDAERAPAGSGVAVRAGCAALRYVPPAPPPHAHALLQIVDYVGAAWEDVVRCGGGKVRYYSE